MNSLRRVQSLSGYEGAEYPGSFLHMLSSLVAIATIGAVRDYTTPRLTVLISIDQFRSDYLRRYHSLFLPPTSGNTLGGFRWLEERGATFVNSHYSHVPLHTGPGHAIISTGSEPSLTGIVANDWFDRKLGKEVYCVADPSTKDLASGKPSASPRNLAVTTIGDELALATSGVGKCVSLSLKDRAAILLGGHAAKEVVWFDKSTGKWTTSDYYTRLPAWADEINKQAIPDKDLGKKWEMTANAPSYFSFPTKKPGSPSTFGSAFPHTLRSGAGYYDDWTHTPWANTFALETARQAIRTDGLGSDEIPDLLTINLSSNDYIGHWFGPYSPEAMDITVETDRDLSRFFNFLNRNIPGGIESVAIVVTADHGALPVVEDLQTFGVPAARLTADFEKTIRAAVAAKVGQDCISDVTDYMVYLDRTKIEASRKTFEQVEEAVKDALLDQPEIYASYTAQETTMLIGASNPFARALSKSYFRPRSGDVFFQVRPGYVFGGSGTDHFTVWNYDTSVPLLFYCGGITAGERFEESGPQDIAPTLAHLLRVAAPSGSVGKVLKLRG